MRYAKELCDYLATNKLEETERNVGLQLTEDEINALRSIIRKGTSERRIVDRARMILWSYDGLPAQEIAQRLSCSRAIVIQALDKFKNNRKNGLPSCLEDFPRTGRPRIKKMRAPKQAL